MSEPFTNQEKKIAEQFKILAKAFWKNYFGLDEEPELKAKYLFPVNNDSLGIKPLQYGESPINKAYKTIQQHKLSLETNEEIKKRFGY
jgi:hypothetical protein